jgi:Asparagine synthase (glutamine-hydrolyzing)
VAPDDSGTLFSDQHDCHFGHLRLSIIDLSPAGHQPMSDSSNRYYITFNGEIYNYLDLIKYLEKLYGRIKWKSASDTEVLIEGFAREGIPFLDKLNGIFSLSIYDTEKRNMYVLRDPLGIKPLFIYKNNSSVLFCSELKGLLSLPDLKKNIRIQSLADQLAFMYVPEPHTMYKEIQKVDPGVCFTYHMGNLVNSTSLFSRLNKPISFSSEAEILESFYNNFSSAVRKQLISDVPVSVMLSGGLDSSAVVYEIINAGAKVQDAYTISISSKDSNYDKQSDDLYYAKIIAQQMGLNLNIIEANADFTSLLPNIISL